MSTPYIFECSCGERFNSITSATNCRKCRNYSYGGRCLYVTNLETLEVVWGRYPTEKENRMYEEQMHREQEELRQELDRLESELDEQHAKHEAKLEQRRIEEEEDQQWDIQNVLEGRRLLKQRYFYI